MNENLKELRMKNAITQTEIGELLDISTKEYIQKESGLVSLTNGEKEILCEYYGVENNSLV